MDQTRLLGLMERGAHHLRRAGLGRAVSRVRERLERSFVPAWTNVGGLWMTGRTIGHVDHLRAWQEGREEAYMTELFKRSVRPGDVVLDVGGYLGWFTLLAARGAGSEGRVIVVEANPASRELLERNIERNGFRGRVTVHAAAVADADGSATFYWDASDGSASGLAAPDNVGGSVEVPVRTLDGLLGGVVPRVVKIDIEGAEPAALRGMRSTLERSAPGSELFIECNPEALANAGASADELLAELRRGGFEVSVIDESTQTLVPVAADATLERHANLYCVKA